MKPLTIPASRAMNLVTLDVRLSGVRRFKCRVWVACRLIQLASFVLGCHVKVERE